MYSYTMLQWLFVFYFYCFFGWCFESTFVSIKKKKFVNRGFMRGPFLPLYGSGAVMMLVVSMPFKDHLWAVFLAGCAGATILEYVTGVTMEALFKVRYWDYSNLPFNFQGQVCLSSTLAWGFLTVFMNVWIHPFIHSVIMRIPASIVTLITWLLTVYIVSDFVLSFKAAMDIRDILIKMEKAKEEMEHMQKRLDVIIALATESWNEKKETLNLKREDKEESSYLEELRGKIEEKLGTLKEMSQKKPSVYLENVKEELMELRVKFRVSEETRNRLDNLLDFNKRDMLKGNPGMKSMKFHDSFEELRKHVEEKNKKIRNKNTKNKNLKDKQDEE